MRTAQRDVGLVTMPINIADAASSSGVAGGIPYTMTRTGGGQYTINFDVRIVPITAVASMVGGAWIPLMATTAPGAVTVNTYSNTFALTNGSFRLIISALDKRS